MNKMGWGNKSRHDIWSDVSRRRAPVLSAMGRTARRRRWMLTYAQMSDCWKAKGDIDTALYWAQRAAACAEEERYVEDQEVEDSELR